MRCVFAIFAVASTLSSGAAEAKVDPDCFAGDDSITCALNRVDEAKEVDKLFTPIIERHGWGWGCFEVEYIKGDNGGPDALVVSVRGPKGAKPPECDQLKVPKLDAETERKLDASGAGVQERMKVLAARAEKEGAARAATDAELMRIGKDLKKAVLHAPKALRSELLRHTNKLCLGSGFSDGVSLPLPEDQ